MPTETGIAGAGGSDGLEVAGGDGEALATEATVDRVADATETTASAVAPDGNPVPGQPVVVIRDAAPLPTFTAAPSAGVDTEAFYLAGAGPQQNDRGGNLRYVFKEPSAEAIEASAGYVAENFPEIIDNRLPVAERRIITSFRPGNVENTDLFGFGGTGTHGINASTRSQEIAIDGTNGAEQWWQSHSKYPLPPGMPFAIVAAVSFSDAGQVNQERRIQVGDDADFLGLTMIGTDVFVAVRSALIGSTTLVPREAWLDPLDGTGQSGVTIDWSQFNTFQLIGGVPGASVGRAWINGVPIINLAAYDNFTAILKHSEQPLRAFIRNTGASAPGHIRIRGFAIHAVGDYRPQVYPTPAPLTTVTRAAGTAGLPVLSIRAKTELGGQPWRGCLLPRLLDLTAKNGDITWQLVENPASLTGASWVSGGDAVGLQYDVSATAMTLGSGRVVGRGTLGSGVSGDRVDLSPIFEEHWSHPLRVRTDGTSDVLTLFVTASIGTANVTSSMLVDVVG